jgi:hypothetical protein
VHQRKPFLVAAVAGFAFGGADQYLGSLHSLGGWPASVSLMSAPWLVLPFLCGCTQELPRQAALLGLAATCAALLGYFALTLSPMENVAFSRFPADWIALIRTDLPTIVGGFLTAPLFGILGQRWRTRRSLLSAALVAGVVCFEPLARSVTGQLSASSVVWASEVAAGLILSGYFALARVNNRERLRER